MKTVILAMILIWAGLTVQAQEPYVSGYIVSLEGDTSRGWVRLRNQTRMHKQVTFRRSSDASIQNFSPTQLSAYGLDERFPYERHEVYFPDDTTRQAVFLRKLFEGDLSFYVLNNRFFLRKANGELESFNYDKEAYPDKAQIVSQRPTVSFTNLLFSQLTPCLSLLQEVQSSEEPLKYEEEVLIDIFRRLHECTGSPYQIYGGNLPKTQFKLSLALDNNLYAWNYTHPTGLTNPYIQASFPMAYTLNPGIGLRVFSPRKNPLFGVSTNLWYKHFSPTGDYAYNSAPGFQVAENIIVNFRSLQGDVGLYTILFVGKRPIYSQQGVFMNYFFKSERNRITTTTNLGTGASFQSRQIRSQEVAADIGIFISEATPITLSGNQRLWLELRLAARQAQVQEAFVFRYRLLESSLLIRYGF